MPPIAVHLVLGIDAAWTAHQPSGVALVEQCGESSRCLAVAPSYDSFLALAAGEPVDWQKRPQGSTPEVAVLLAAAEQIGGRPVDLIAYDMPLSTEKISGRRAADRQVSQLYGSRGCAVHSPTAQRPGAMADNIRATLQELDYPLHVAGEVRGAKGVIEVYPHVALLALLQVPFRFPYKVSRSLQYWKSEHLTAAARIERLLHQFVQIRVALDQHIGAIDLPLPEPDKVASLSALKSWEDCLDALICAWVGMEHLQGRTQGLGDATAAIWCPRAAFHGGSVEND